MTSHDKPMSQHVGKAIHEHLRETQFPEWPAWDKLKECTQCVETAEVAIEAYRSYLTPSQVAQGLSYEHSEGKTFDYHTTDGRPCRVTVPPGHDGEIVAGVLRVTPNKHSEELDPSVMPPRNPPD